MFSEVKPNGSLKTTSLNYLKLEPTDQKELLFVYPYQCWKMFYGEYVPIRVMPGESLFKSTSTANYMPWTLFLELRFGRKQVKVSGNEPGSNKEGDNALLEMKKYGDEIEPFMLRDEYEAALRRCGMKISNRLWLHKNQYLGGYLRTIPYNEAECEKEHGDKIKFVNATIPIIRCRARPIMILSLHALVQIWHEFV
ncbi:unnamed protein product [Caenorhabditis brenneri]